MLENMAIVPMTFIKRINPQFFNAKKYDLIIILGYTFFILFIFLALEFANCSMFLRQVGTLSTFCWFMCYTPLIVNALVECQFICYVMLITQRVLAINVFLTKMLRLEPLDPLKSCNSKVLHRERKILVLIQSTRKMHMNLFEVARIVGDAFSVQFLFTTFVEFVAFTSHAYYCFNGLTNMYLYDRQPDLYDMITTTLWGASRIMQFLAVAFACNVVKRHVSMYCHVNDINMTALSINIAFKKNLKSMLFWLTVGIIEAKGRIALCLVRVRGEIQSII